MQAFLCIVGATDRYTFLSLDLLLNPTQDFCSSPMLTILIASASWPFTQAVAIVPDSIPTAACDVSGFLLLLLHRKGVQRGENWSSGTQDWTPKEPLGAALGASGATAYQIYPV